MKILFYGKTAENSGPGYVNMCYLRHLTASFCTVKSENKYSALAEGLWKLLRCDSVVVSGVSPMGCILVGVAFALGKPSAYIMHGSAAREAEWNPDSGAAWKQEAYLLERADLLLPVSKKFRNWVRTAYPQYAGKTGYLHSGIEKPKTIPAKIPGTVAAAGGNGGIKGNHMVAEAVEAMGGKARLTVYGPVHGEIPKKQYKYVRYTGRLPREEFLEQLGQTELFVLNSLFESFSMATLEALTRGCSVLVSENAGVTEVLALREEDVIHDPMDAAELGPKIACLLEHPNNARLMEALDLDGLSWESAVERLEELCRDMRAKL